MMISIQLFPAYAGVIPSARKAEQTTPPFPRIRGGDPGITYDADDASGFSPHMRG